MTSIQLPLLVGAISWRTIPLGAELILVVTFLLLVIFHFLLKPAVSKYLAIIAFPGLLLAALYRLTANLEGPWSSLEIVTQNSFAGDGLCLFFQLIFLLATAAVVLLAFLSRSFEGEKMGLYYALLLSGCGGAFLLAGSTDFIISFLGYQAILLSGWALLTFPREDERSREGAVKYILYTALTSGLMLYGFSLLYGLTGSTKYAALAHFVSGEVQRDFITLTMAVLLSLAGISSLLGLFPFHFWVPDVGEAAPPATSAYFWILVKGAGLVFLLRFGQALIPLKSSPFAYTIDWPGMMALLAAVTMTLGNLGAVWQSNIRRLLAYVSLAHTGYLLMGVALLGRGSEAGLAALLFFFTAYILAFLGILTVVLLVQNRYGIEEIRGYRGLLYRSPLLAFTFGGLLLSLLAFPPTVGFAGHFSLFVYVIREKFYWLAVIGGLNIALSAYYYLRLIKMAFLAQPLEQKSSSSAPSQSLGDLLAAFSLTLGLGLGILFGPYFSLLERVKMSDFNGVVRKMKKESSSLSLDKREVKKGDSPSKE